MTAETIGRLGAARQWAATNWFVAALPALLLIEFAFSRSADARAAPTLLEATLLFDLCVFVPALFFLCYRRTLGAKALALRMIGLACFGVTFASWMVPSADQAILPYLSWPRVVGVVLLVLVEIKLFVQIMRLVWGSEASTHDIVDRRGLPPVLVRLMMLEVRFWKAVWRFVRGR